MMTNKELIERYPWLLPTDCEGNRVPKENYDYDWTILDDMPTGWRKTFGEDLCEEINQCLIKHNITDYEVVQIKEKFGSLRWYDNGLPEEGREILRKYELLSDRTCINCGKPATKVSIGWISPWCDECAEEIHDNFEDINEFYD